MLSDTPLTGKRPGTTFYPVKLIGLSRQLLATNVAISPNGTYIAYIGIEDGETHAFVQSTRGPSRRRIPGTDGVSTIFFSPDGEWLGFQAKGWLWRVRIEGGTPIDIAPVENQIIGACWGTNGYIVYTSGYSAPLKRVPVNGGQPKSITKRSAEDFSHRYPALALNGDLVLFEKELRSGGSEIWATRISSGETERLIAGSRPVYVSNKLLFYRYDENQALGSIWAVQVDPSTMSVASKAALIVDETTPTYAANEEMLLYAPRRTGAASRLILRSPQGSESTLGEANYFNSPAFSLDGRRIAVARTTDGDRLPNIWVYDLQEASAARQVTFEGAWYPIWTSNKSFLYATMASTETATINKYTLGSGDPPETIVGNSHGFIFPMQWLGNGFLYAPVNDVAQGDLYLQEDGETRVLDAGPLPTESAEISPNGHWLVYAQWESGRPAVYVKPYPQGEERWEISSKRGHYPRWAPDGRSIYFMSFGRLMRVAVSTAKGSIAFGSTEVVRSTNGWEDILYDPFDVGPDGSLAFVEVQYPKPDVQVLMRNWQRLLE